MQTLIDNFTAILPVTCNADCGFCPEKESDKTDKATYIENLVQAINDTSHMGYDHISISGGEPSLDPRLLKSVITAIHERTAIKKVGLTTNGLFMESEAKLRSFVSAITDEYGTCLLDFINVSRHSVRNDVNNKIMKVNYKHTMQDLILFRAMLPQELSFHINMVISEDSDYHELMSDIATINPVLKQYNIDGVFRTDYAWQKKLGAELVPNELMTLFSNTFDGIVQSGGCPTCITFRGRTEQYSNLYLKGANFEPTDNEDLARELIMHMDGKLYYDWSRNKPFVYEIETDDAISSLIGGRTLPDMVFELKTRPIPVKVSQTVVLDSTPCRFRTQESAASCGYGGSSCGGGGSCG